jgi:UDP-glucose 4-epimerase
MVSALKTDRRIVLVTGASGFVGTALCPALERQGWTARKASTSRSGPEWSYVQRREGHYDWLEHLQGCAAVVHLAGRAHVTLRMAGDDDAAYLEINADATFDLAYAAAAAGVSRFVFISSVKVNGEGQPFAYTEDDVPSPEDSYGRSKWAAERGLIEISQSTGMELVILRLPLVYGPHVRANFLRLMQWVDRGVPLPFASVYNRRSLLGVDNLTDAIYACLEVSAAAGRTYFVSDQEDVSTPELIELLASVLGRKPRLWSIPKPLFQLSTVTSIGAYTMKRLTASLTVDSSRISSELGWRPPNSLRAGLVATARWLRSS